MITKKSFLKLTHFSIFLSLTLIFLPSLIFAQDTSSFKFEGYVDGYYSYFTDSMGHNYQQFPTIAPRSNNFGLNVIQLNGAYDGENCRTNIILHFGDMPESVFPTELNIIKEAFAGIQLGPVWLDAGIFYTHLRTEEVTPKDNFMSINALGTYFQPNNQAGIRLSYEVSENLSFEGYFLNGYGVVVDNNDKKSVGFDMDYTPFENFNIYYSNYFGDDSDPIPGVKQNKNRMYNNLILSYSLWDKLNFKVGFDFGIQNNSQMKDTTRRAHFSNFIGIVNYKIFPKFALNLRADDFNDVSAALSDVYLNTDSVNTGLSAKGLSIGIEYKPSENSYFRIDSRRIIANDKLKLFYNDQKFTNLRDEIVFTVGLWF